MARIAPVLLALGLAACDVYLDVGQPIALVPESGWRAEHLEQMRDATALWNEQFHTQLRVDPGASSGQRVTVVFSDLVCGYANGITQCYDSLEVQICTLDAIVPHRLRALFLHELGHVLNIRDHAEDPLAVMHAESSGSKTFRYADYLLFDDANPGFY